MKKVLFSASLLFFLLSLSGCFESRVDRNSLSEEARSTLDSDLVKTLETAISRLSEKGAQVPFLPDPELDSETALQVQKLILQGADPGGKIPQNEAVTLALYSAMAGLQKTTEVFKKYGNLKDIFLETASGTLATVKALWTEGQDINMVLGEEGSSLSLVEVLVISWEKGNKNKKEILDFLLSKNHDFTRSHYNGMINLYLMALRAGDLDLFKTLVDAIPETFWRESAILEAIRTFNNADATLYALEKKVLILTESNGKVLMDPLISEGKVEELKLLLKAGVPLYSRDEKGNTPLFYARTAAMADFLLTQGVPGGQVNNAGESELLYMVKNQSLTGEGPGVVTRLLQAGASLDVKDRDGFSLYHWVLYKGMNYLKEQIETKNPELTSDLLSLVLKDDLTGFRKYQEDQLDQGMEDVSLAVIGPEGEANSLIAFAVAQGSEAILNALMENTDTFPRVRAKGLFSEYGDEGEDFTLLMFAHMTGKPEIFNRILRAWTDSLVEETNWGDFLEGPYSSQPKPLTVFDITAEDSSANRKLRDFLQEYQEGQYRRIDSLIEYCEKYLTRVRDLENEMAVQETRREEYLNESYDEGYGGEGDWGYNPSLMEEIDRYNQITANEVAFLREYFPDEYTTLLGNLYPENLEEPGPDY